METTTSDRGYYNDLEALADVVPTVEPGDPRRNIDHQSRRETRIAPPKYDVDAKPLLECGCDDCPPDVDPLAESGKAVYAANECPNPRSVTVEKGGEIYLRYQKAALEDDEMTSMCERDRAKYGKIMASDRRFREEYEGLTVMLLSLRLSPLGDDGWIHPTRLDEMLQNPYERVLRALRRQMSTFDRWEYVAVTTPTESAATPHTHLLVWVEDPDDEITPYHGGPALDKHLKYCANAYESDHQYDRDGDGGAIWVDHDPSTVDNPPEKFASLAEDGRLKSNTAAAQYVSAQLPHLHLRDVFEPTRDVPQPLIDGAVTDWASSNRWFAASSGVS